MRSKTTKIELNLNFTQLRKQHAPERMKLRRTMQPKYTGKIVKIISMVANHFKKTKMILGNYNCTNSDIYSRTPTTM